MVSWSKLGATTLFILVSFSPLIYGLMNYNWDVERLLTPSYEPPKIDFQTDIKERKLVGDRFYTILELNNLGEIDITISDVDASLYGVDGRVLTNIGMDEPVRIGSGEEKTLNLYIPFGSDTIHNILKYFLETNSMEVVVNGTLHIEVYASTVEFPIKMSINLPDEIINMYISGITIEFTNAYIEDSTLKLNLTVTNPTPITWIIENSTLKIYTMDMNQLGNLELSEATKVEAGDKSILTLETPLTLEKMIKIIEYFNGDTEKTFIISGEINVRAASFMQRIDINTTIQLNRELFSSI